VGAAARALLELAGFVEVAAETLLRPGALGAQAGLERDLRRELPLEHRIGIEAALLVVEATLGRGEIVVVEVVVDGEAVLAVLELAGDAELGFDAVQAHRLRPAVERALERDTV